MKAISEEIDGVGEKQFDLEIGEGKTLAHPRFRKQKSGRKGPDWKFFSLAGELGFDIALPMVLGLICGIQLDARFGTHPRATLILFVIGCVIAGTSLIRIVRDASKER